MAVAVRSWGCKAEEVVVEEMSKGRALACGIGIRDDKEGRGGNLSRQASSDEILNNDTVRRAIENII